MMIFRFDPSGTAPSLLLMRSTRCFDARIRVADSTIALGRKRSNFSDLDDSAQNSQDFTISYRFITIDSPMSEQNRTKDRIKAFLQNDNSFWVLS